MRTAMIWLLWAGLSTAPGSAMAACACLCLDGSYRAVCTAPDALQSTADVCQARFGQGCASPTAPNEARTYPAPAAGVDNCRDAQVFDAAADDFIVVRVCDVAPDG
jgi:hypothetical protein